MEERNKRMNKRPAQGTQSSSSSSSSSSQSSPSMQGRPRLVSETTIDLLHFTIVDTYWGDLESHPERPVIQPSDPTLSRRKKRQLEEEQRQKYMNRVLLYDGGKKPERVYSVIEEMGFRVGQRMAERLLLLLLLLCYDW